MDYFYLAGKTAALQKLSLSGVAKRLLVGGGVGAAGGALLGGEENRGTGALLGGLAGAGGMAGAGHLARKSMQSQVGQAMKAVPKGTFRTEMGRSMRPVVMREQQALMPSWDRVHSAMKNAPPVG